MVIIKDISRILNSQMSKARKEFQMLLFSSLSHEKLAPLNNISDMTECALSKVSQAIEKAKKEVINNNVSNFARAAS